MYTFPDLLKKIRQSSGLTQEGFAKGLGVSTVLISMIETGQKEASKGFIAKLAGKLGVNPSSIVPFLFIDKDMNKNNLHEIEKNLIRFGEKLQNYLIEKKAKKLNPNVY